MEQQLEMPATSVLSLFETTKEQRMSFVMSVVDQLQTGNADALKVHLHVKMMEETVKLLNANSIYKSAVLEAAEKYGEKSFQVNNAKVEIKEVGVKYDFSKTEDITLLALYKQQEELDAKIKARETMLKSVDGKGMIVVDQESGETFTVYPPAKSSTTSVAITLK